MLVLSRNPGERINIGNDIIIEVLELRGQRVRIGITAPDLVPVHRGEVYDTIHSAPEPTLSLWFASCGGVCFVAPGATIQQAKAAAAETLKSLGHIPLHIKLECMGPVFDSRTGDNVALHRFTLEKKGFVYHETEDARDA